MKFTLRGHPLDVAFSSDGRYLIAAGILLFVAFDLSTDPPVQITPAVEADLPTLRVVALSDPALALLLNWFPDRCRADVVHVPSGETVRVTELMAPDSGQNSAPFSRLAVSGGGTRFAAAGDVVTLFDREAMAPMWERPIRYFSIAFSHDSKWVIAAAVGNLVAFDATTGRTLVESWLNGTAAREAITALVVDPGGAWVYAGTSLGKVYALAAGTLELCAVFEWHLGWIQDLAVTADGSRLFSSGGDGCVKVWPIRDLLRGVNGPAGPFSSSG